MECKLSISSNKTWISSDVLFDFDWLMSYLNLVFEGLFWIDDDESITGYLWGIPRFKIEVIAKPIEVEIPKKGGVGRPVGRPVGSGRVDHIVAGMKKEIKERIKNGELSARQISQMFDLSFPSSQKIIKRIQER